jgi:hypothetical protein
VTPACTGACSLTETAVSVCDRRTRLGGAALQDRRARRGLVEAAGTAGTTTPAVERVATRIGVELAHEARELLRSIAALGAHRRTALTLRAAGYSLATVRGQVSELANAAGVADRVGPLLDRAPVPPSEAAPVILLAWLNRRAPRPSGLS